MSLNEDEDSSIKSVIPHLQELKTRMLKNYAANHF